MGLAASQAKLLSITTRLSNNELRSQTLTAAKIALSNQTSAASKKYINAQNSTELLYGTYDMNGNKTTIALTGAALSEYAPLKNQYALINSSGQVLVSETQANYYERSQNINDYLEFNGIEKIEMSETRTVTNPAYQDAYDDWKEEYDEWLVKKPDKSDPIYWQENVTTSSAELYDSFLWATSICYGSVMNTLCHNLNLDGLTVYDSEGNIVLDIFQKTFENGCSDYVWTAYKDDKSGESIIEEEDGSFGKCYAHVFTHLLHAGVYTTTTGNTFKIFASDDFGDREDHPMRWRENQHWWDLDEDEEQTNHRWTRVSELANILSEEHDPVYYCCQKDPADVDITPTSSDAEKLMSDYYFDEDGNVKTKTLHQKIVDLDYAAINDLFSSQEKFDAIQHFVNEDLMILYNVVTDEFLEDDYNDDYEEWLSKKPPFDVPPTIEETVYSYEYAEGDEAQWYVNLWHRMNGASDTKDGNQTTSSTNTTGFWNEMIHNETTTTTQRWAVLEDGLMNSSKWLQNALAQGTVTLEQVQFTGESTESNTGLKDVSWKSIIYSSAQDITEQTDETAIAKAEAEYERAQNDIEAKDKQFDNMLKLLDTEHEALQTEYESVQQVINKNISRTLKIYSA